MSVRWHSCSRRIYGCPILICYKCWSFKSLCHLLIYFPSVTPCSMTVTAPSLYKQTLYLLAQQSSTFSGISFIIKYSIACSSVIDSTGFVLWSKYPRMLLKVWLCFVLLEFPQPTGGSMPPRMHTPSAGQVCHLCRFI